MPRIQPNEAERLRDEAIGITPDGKPLGAPEGNADAWSDIDALLQSNEVPTLQVADVQSMPPVVLGGPPAADPRLTAMWNAKRKEAENVVALTQHEAFRPTKRPDNRPVEVDIQVLFGVGMKDNPAAYKRIRDGAIFMTTNDFPKRNMRAGTVMLLPVIIAGRVMTEGSYRISTIEEVRRHIFNQRRQQAELEARDRDTYKRIDPQFDKEPNPAFQKLATR